MAVKTLATAVSAFGTSAKLKLNNPAISGAPGDQLRGPLETLVRDLAIIGGLFANTVDLVGGTTLAHLQTRPDSLLAFFTDFLIWAPEPPPNADNEEGAT